MTGLLAAPVAAPAQVAGRVNVRLDAGEARAVLSILAGRAGGQAPTTGDWDALWQSRGHRRLAEREAAMRRPFPDSAFRTFVLSDSLLARRDDLARALAAWENADITGAAERALAYLPPNAQIRATIYPVIKPQTNSFVFDLLRDPSMFLYLDPAVAPDKFENTLAHELHHIGYGAACAREDAADSVRAAIVRWLGSFGEGMAVLAAAGGASVHPHAVSPADERQRWDRDVANAPADMRRLQAFFTDILDGRLRGDSITTRGMSFFGVQGPWYTVGWIMASAIERAFGRDRLVAVMCDPVSLLETYDHAAARLNRSGENLPRWDAGFLARLRS